ncbi:MAG: TonB-dependent receptor [Chloracidobacterium sp.]|nr:TonB-dependent receptor [Chloracidobacterium sp.]
MKTRSSISVLLFGLLIGSLTLCSSKTFAQQETATITGEVRDANSSVVPKATVIVTNAETNVSVKSETNDQGLYTVPSLKPGPYSITVEKAGFKKSVRSGVTLQVNQVARLDVILQVGDMTTAVEVVEAATLLETETSSRGAVIDQKKIVDLPLNGRDYNQLALLSPGVLAGTPRMASINFKGAINVNGNRLFMNVFLLDGVDNVSYSSSYRGDNVQVVQPSIEALQEFKIQTNAYSAEFGRSAGAVINATIKSGGNSFHGAGYEFLRNKVLDANNFFANLADQEKPARQRNQFGGTIGGPIIKDKTFFFTDYEGLRDREGTVRFSTLPLPSQKQGIFSSTVVDPFNNRTAFPNNTIPSNRFDPVGKAVVALIPDPNLPIVNNNPANDYVNTPVTSTRSDQFDVRIDHNYSSTLNLFGRYSFVDSHLFRPAPMPGLAEGSFNDAFGTGNSRSQGVAAGATWTLNSQMAADLHFGFTRGDYYVFPPNFGIDGAQQVGLQNVPNTPDIVGGLPKFNIQGFSAIGRHTSTPQFQTPRSYDIKASLSDLHGRHFLKYGAEFLFVQTGIRDINALIGSLSFSNGVFTGQALGDLLLGLPQRLSLTSNTVLNNSQRLSFFYVQDDFKVTSKLTLNYGLRYEYATPPVERDNQFANFDPTTGTMIFAKDGSLFDRALVHPDRNNFAPRFGFAYSPNGRWVLRGAYGVFYNHVNRQGREGLLGFNPPFLVDNSIAVSQLNTTASNAIFRLQDGYPAGLLDPSTLSNTIMRRAQDMNQRTPYVQQYNFGIQRELIKDLLLEVAYVGNKGTKLPGFRNINPKTAVFTPSGVAQGGGPRPYPQFGDIQFMEDRADSNYQSLQVRVEKRYSRGLTFLGSYTYGKALTDAPDHLSTSGVGAGFDVGTFKEPQNPNDVKAEHGLAEFDIKHRAVISYIWEIPYGKGRAYGNGVSPLVNTILGGWNLTGIHTFQSGLGLTPNQSGGAVLDLGGERRGRPNLIGDPNGPQTIDQWFNTAAFSPIDPNKGQVFGTSGVGVMRGPGLIDFDFTLAKDLHITESKYFQFRTEIFNAFNHANFGIPSLDIASSTFGTIRVTATPARIIQFALKFYY